MKLTLIAARSRNNVIGKEGKIPWQLKTDLKHFAKTTKGHPIIMGRETFESLPGLLPDRKHIVLTRQPYLLFAGAVTVGSLEEAIEECQDADEAFIIGGGKVYEQAISLVDQMVITEVGGIVEGDTYFPSFNHSDFTVTKRDPYPKGEGDQYNFDIVTYVRA